MTHSYKSLNSYMIQLTEKKVVILNFCTKIFIIISPTVTPVNFNICAHHYRIFTAMVDPNHSVRDKSHKQHAL